MNIILFTQNILNSSTEMRIKVQFLRIAKLNDQCCYYIFFNMNSLITLKKEEKRKNTVYASMMPLFGWYLCIGGMVLLGLATT